MPHARTKARPCIGAALAGSPATRGARR
jgi:hypothetical protein